MIGTVKKQIIGFLPLMRRKKVFLAVVLTSIQNP